jgi:hypothetical protein
MPSFPADCSTKLKPCTCNGPCSGYATRSNCPPLIVLAIAAVSQISIPAS